MNTSVSRGSLLVLSISLICISLSIPFHAKAAPGEITFQGALKHNGSTAANGIYAMEFRIYNLDSGGTPLWSEQHDVTVANGLYTAVLGQSNAVNENILSSYDDLWMEIIVNGDILAPRIKLTSTAFALFSNRAGEASNADMVDGSHASSLEESGEIDADISAHASNASAHHIKTTSFTELTGEIADEQIPTTIVRDSELEWSNLSGIPPGFSDNTDNDSGGDITSVIAGSGLSGGATAGDASLQVTVPLELTGISISPIIKGLNNGNGAGVMGQQPLSQSLGYLGWSNVGVYGFDNDSYGVQGISDTGYGIYGSASLADGTAVYGINSSSGNYGLIGNAGAGVKGQHADTGNTGSLGTSFSGVFGAGQGAANGVYGSSTSGNYGYLGGLLYGVYGSANGSGSYAGYFLGNTTVSSGSLDLVNSSSSSWMNILRGTNQLAGIAYKEGTSSNTQWIFPFIRGWQSDNLIVRDEASLRDVMTFQAGTGRVGIGANPLTLLHVSSGTSGDATLFLEADTDNNNEGDQPSIEMQQDGGQTTAKIGFLDSANELKIQSTKAVEVHVVGDGTLKHVATFDHQILLDDGVIKDIGKLHVNGEITHSPKTGYQTVGAHQFRYAGQYMIAWLESINLESSAPEDYVDMLYAPIQLPHKCVITKVTASFRDFETGDGKYGTITLKRSNIYDGASDDMSDEIVFVSLNPDIMETAEDDSISFADIDNRYYSYVLRLSLPVHVRFFGATIEYTTTNVN